MIVISTLRGWSAVPVLGAAIWIAFAMNLLPSDASVGVGVQVKPVRLGEVAYAGASYSLPPVQVGNTGTQTEWLRLRIERLSRGAARPVPPSWIHADNVPLRLGPQQTARIPLRLAVPATAKRGPYLSDVVIIASAAVAVGNTSFGAAAATKLEFRVMPARHQGLWPVLPTWLRWAALIIALAAAAGLTIARSGLRIRVERAAATPSRTYRHGSPDA